MAAISFGSTGLVRNEHAGPDEALNERLHARMAGVDDDPLRR